MSLSVFKVSYFMANKEFQTNKQTASIILLLFMKYLISSNWNRLGANHVILGRKGEIYCKYLL